MGPPSPAWVYILRLSSGRLYVGSTTNLERRLRDHDARRACRTTVGDPAVSLVYAEPQTTFSGARHREAQIKRWTARKKEALVSGDLARLRALARRRQPGRTAR